MTSSDVRTEVRTARSRALSAACAQHPEHATAWQASVQPDPWETPPPLAVGSRVAFVARFLGRTPSHTAEVSEHVPGVRLVMSTTGEPYPVETG